eukprot:m.12846 g.12846  ORF g.12846 m.12846 type:complete len:1043 (-) comp2763_c0_seq1:89-3217(-)
MALLTLPMLRPTEIAAQPTLEVDEWGPSEVVTWLRGVEPLLTEQLALLTAANLKGTQLLAMTASDLQAFKIDTVGQQETILAAIQALGTMNSHAKCPAFQWLGQKLLQAGRRIDERPLNAAADMMAALSQAISEMDCAPPANLDKYVTLRAQLVEHAAGFLADLEANHAGTGLGSKVREMIRLLLPTLTELGALFPSKKEDECKLHVVTVQRTKSSDLNMSFDLNELGYVYVSHIVPKGQADVCGMLRVGDQILRVDSQNVVGWRPKKVDALLQSTTLTVRFSIKISTREFDARIAALMEQARLIRQSVSTPRRTMTGPKGAAPEATSSKPVEGDTQSLKADTVSLTEEPASAGAATDAPPPMHSHHAVAITESEPVTQRESVVSQARQSVPADPRVSQFSTAPSSYAGDSLQSTSNTRQSSIVSLPVIPAAKPAPGTYISDVESHKRRVRGSVSGSVAEEDSDFHSEGSSLTITSPARHQRISAGKNCPIKWFVKQQLANVAGFNVYLSAPGQTTMHRIASHVLNIGSFDWSIPANLQPGFGYRIFLEQVDRKEGQGLTASSDPFIISPTTSESARVVYVTRSGPDREFGFETDGVFVSRATAESKLFVGDQLLMINGISVSNMTHVGVLNALNSYQDQATLLVVSNTAGFARFAEQRSLITKASKEPLALCLLGLPILPDGLEALGMRLQVSNGIVVVEWVHTDDDATAELRQQLGNGSCIVQVNRQDLMGATQKEIAVLFKYYTIHPLDLLFTTNYRALEAFYQEIALLRTACALGEDVCAELQHQLLSQRSKTMDHRPASKKSLDVPMPAVRSVSCSMPRKASIPLDINTPCAAVAHPEAEGWLCKLGGSGLTPKNWRTRWFVLKQGTLLYYKSREDTEALGCIRLFGYLVSPAPPGKRMHNKFGFKISKPDSRTYYVCAEDEASMKKWMNAMSLAAICVIQSSEERERQEQFDRERAYLQKHGVVPTREPGDDDSQTASSVSAYETGAPPAEEIQFAGPAHGGSVNRLAVEHSTRNRAGSAGQERLSRLRGKPETVC